MARRRANNAAVTQQTYALLPVRSRAAQLATRVALCLLAAVAGAAGTMAYVTYYHHLPAMLCAALPGDDAQTRFERTKLALEQERAARVAVQKTADASAAEVVRLNTELQFLRQQAQQH